MHRILAIALFVFLSQQGFAAGSSREANLRLAIENSEDGVQTDVLALLDKFATQRNLRMVDSSATATELLGRPTVVRFYQGADREIVVITNRVKRSRLLIGIHDADGVVRRRPLSKALLLYLQDNLAIPLVVNPAE